MANFMLPMTMSEGIGGNSILMHSEVHVKTDSPLRSAFRTTQEIYLEIIRPAKDMAFDADCFTREKTVCYLYLRHCCTGYGTIRYVLVSITFWIYISRYAAIVLMNKCHKKAINTDKTVCFVFNA